MARGQVTLQENGHGKIFMQSQMCSEEFIYQSALSDACPKGTRVWGSDCPSEIPEVSAAVVAWPKAASRAWITTAVARVTRLTARLNLVTSLG